MESHVKQALEIVTAQASVRVMTEEEILAMIQKLSESIRLLSEGTPPVEETDEPSLDPKKAIKEKSITCVECGKVFRILTKKHLGLHGLTAAEYREKHGYKKGLPLVCKSLQRERRKKMRDMKLWERRGLVAKTPVAE